VVVATAQDHVSEAAVHLHSRVVGLLEGFLLGQVALAVRIIVSNNVEKLPLLPSQEFLLPRTGFEVVVGSSYRRLFLTPIVTDFAEVEGGSLRRAGRWLRKCILESRARFFGSDRDLADVRR
jgi:hypothetical protein